METTQEKLLRLLDAKTGGGTVGMRLDIDDPVFRYKLNKGMAMRPEAREDNLYVTCLLNDDWTGVQCDAHRVGRAVFRTLEAVQ